ncbi:hypothetical protein LTR28_002055 [Elasticomyces elasticus]|nr:hypothetical protein LTR28_002055 [Elasticomyces elasticus]
METFVRNVKKVRILLSCQDVDHDLPNNLRTVLVRHDGGLTIEAYGLKMQLRWLVTFLGRAPLLQAIEVLLLDGIQHVAHIVDPVVIQWILEPFRLFDSQDSFQLQWREPEAENNRPSDPFSSPCRRLVTALNVDDLLRKLGGPFNRFERIHKAHRGTEGTYWRRFQLASICTNAFTICFRRWLSVELHKLRETLLAQLYIAYDEDDFDAYQNVISQITEFLEAEQEQMCESITVYQDLAEDINS